MEVVRSLGFEVGRGLRCRWVVVAGCIHLVRWIGVVGVGVVDWVVLLALLERRNRHWGVVRGACSQHWLVFDLVLDSKGSRSLYLAGEEAEGGDLFASPLCPSYTVQSALLAAPLPPAAAASFAAMS